MNELLGFIALTSPLIFILIWILISIPLAIFLVKKIAKKERKGITKIILGFIIASIIFLIPFADAIIGRIYFSYLCQFNGGPIVYNTITLPGEYWDTNGNPMFLKENGDLDNKLLKNRVVINREKIRYSNTFNIDKYSVIYFDSEKHIVLGEVINYFNWGGWISNNLTLKKNAQSCPQHKGNEFWRKFRLSIFIHE